MSADVSIPASAHLPFDTREAQCQRAADYMEAHPGCTLRNLAIGADLGSASKVVSEMCRTFGYQVRRESVRIPCEDGEHSRYHKRYWLKSRPQMAQFDLFSS